MTLNTLRFRMRNGKLNTLIVEEVPEAVDNHGAEGVTVDGDPVTVYWSEQFREWRTYDR